MANAAEKIAFDIGDKVAEKLDVSVVDVNFVKEAGKQYLRIFIDKDGGVDTDICSDFSHMFEEEFDKIDPIETEYILEVSSPGLDRKLKTEREFKHFLGREVDVKLFKMQDGRKEFTGILEDFDGKTAKINIGDDAVLVNIKESAYIRLHFEF